MPLLISDKKLCFIQVQLKYLNLTHTYADGLTRENQTVGLCYFRYFYLHSVL